MAVEREKEIGKLPPPTPGRGGAEEGAGAEGSRAGLLRICPPPPHRKLIASAGSRLHPSPPRHSAKISWEEDPEQRVPRV